MTTKKVDPWADSTGKPAPESTKPGIKSTEFWITVLTGIIGTLIAAWGASKGSDGITAVGGIAMAMATGSYNHSRGTAKKKGGGQ